MEKTLGLKPHSVLRAAKELLKGAASFLSTLFIITALTVTGCYLFKIKPYVVMTGSMEPAIPVSSICFVNETVPADSIKTGDVIAFRSGEMLVTHRVTAINEGRFTTKGDANDTEDAAPVTAENYIGKTVLTIPKAGIVIRFLHTIWGKITAGAVIVLLIAVSFKPKERSKEWNGQTSKEPL